MRTGSKSKAGRCKAAGRGRRSRRPSSAGGSPTSGAASPASGPTAACFRCRPWSRPRPSSCRRRRSPSRRFRSEETAAIRVGGSSRTVSADAGIVNSPRNEPCRSPLAGTGRSRSELREVANPCSVPGAPEPSRALCPSGGGRIAESLRAGTHAQRAFAQAPGVEEVRDPGGSQRSSASGASRAADYGGGGSSIAGFGAFSSSGGGSTAAGGGGGGAGMSV
jgi:hypothetical protein